MKCRQCGALLVAPPVPVPTAPPVAPFAPGAMGGTAGAPATAVEESFYAPATLTPVIVAPPAPRDAAKRRGPIVPIVIAIVVLAGAAAAYATVGPGSGGSGSASKTPVTLPAIAESSGIPNLEAALRIQAESSRQHASVVVAEASAEMGGGPLDVQTLRNLDPSLEWVTAEQSSTGPKVVSFSQSGDTVIVAVATKSGDVCAFGRTSPAAVGEYVTLGNVRSCRAADAPASGWTQLSPVGGGSRYAPPEGMDGDGY